MRREGFGGGRGFGGGAARDFQQKAAPVKVGEELDVMIEGVGAKGDGIAKVEGFVIFVPGTNRGDTVRVRVTKVLNNMAFAEVADQGSHSSSDSSDSSQPRKEAKGGKEEESSGNGGKEAEAEPAEQPADTENFGEEEQ